MEKTEQEIFENWWKNADATKWDIDTFKGDSQTEKAKRIAWNAWKEAYSIGKGDGVYLLEKVVGKVRDVVDYSSLPNRVMMTVMVLSDSLKDVETQTAKAILEYIQCEKELWKGTRGWDALDRTDECIKKRYPRVIR